MSAVSLLQGGLCAQPGVGQNGVVNSASQIPTSLPGGALARGALITIHGVRLGDAGRTTVTLTRAEVSTPLRLVKIQPNLIQAIVPPSMPVGPASLMVVADGKQSRPFPLEIADYNPGIFTLNEEGWGAGRVDDIAASGERSRNSPSTPARRGGRAALFITGAGGARQISVVIGNRTVTAGPPKPTDRAGEEEITIRIPNDAPTGCFVPVYIQAGPRRASNVVTISIQSPGQASPPTCDAPAKPLLAATRAGVVAVTRISMKPDKKAGPDVIDDSASVDFFGKDAFPIRLPFPPPGTCTAYTNSFQNYIHAPSSPDSILKQAGALNSDQARQLKLDAGAELTLRRGGQSRTLRLLDPGRYRASLGGQGTGPSLEPFLEPGELLLSVPGGRDVSGFTASIGAPIPVEWKDREQISVVDREHPPVLHWSPARGMVMLVIAANVDQITTASGTCVCSVNPEAGEFQMPAALLGNIPASQNIPGVPYDRVYLASISMKELEGIEHSKLNSGVSVGVYAVGRIVRFR